jgi:hypothetical protein
MEKRKRTPPGVAQISWLLPIEHYIGCIQKLRGQRTFDTIKMALRNSKKWFWLSFRTSLPASSRSEGSLVSFKSKRDSSSASMTHAGLARFTVNGMTAPLAILPPAMMK